MPHTYQDVELTEITHDNFDAEGWPQLIGKLLYLEASVYSIPIDCLSFCYRTKKDGGIDLLVYNIATSSKHIKSPATIYACKAYGYTKGGIDRDLKPFSTDRKKRTKKDDLGLKQQFKDLMQNGAHMTWVIKHSISAINSIAIRQETIGIIKKYYNIDVPIDNIHVYTAETILDWVNDKTKSPIMNTLARQYVRASLGYPESDSVVPLWQWLKDPQYTTDFNDIYYYDEHFERLKVRAIETLFGGAPNVFMLISGLSGLGKTSLIRWILTEYLSTLDEDERNMVAARTIYYEWDNDDKKLINGLLSMKDMIVIIDNCTTEIAQYLWARRSRVVCMLVLITSDLETKGKLIHDVEHIFLNPDECVGAVNKYLETQTLKTDDKEVIKKYSHGFVYYAIHMAQELVRGGEESNILCVAQDISERIIGKVFMTGDYSDEQLYLPVLRACALFSEFGWDDNGDYHSDLSWIVENLVHFQITVPNKEKVIFHVCRIGYEHKIFERRGSYLSLRPMPLAYMLVSKYLSNLTPNEKRALISFADNTQLAESMARQFAHYNQMPESKLVVEGILDSLYADFSVRNPIFKKKGARVFLALLNVHPKKCLEIIIRCYDTLSLEVIRSQKETRSYLVHALEKLVFPKEYFVDAIGVLYKLAQAENEAWSNNATGTLVQLFQLYLPGTEASLSERSELIMKWYKRANELSMPIILQILEGSIRTRHFGRNGGYNRFGSGLSFEDYRPTSDEEVITYFTNSLTLLKEIIDSKSVYAQRANSIVIQAIEGFVHLGLWEAFSKLFGHNYWQEDDLQEVQKQLSHAIRFKRANEATCAEITKYSDMLFNDTFQRRIINLVVNNVVVPYDETVIEMNITQLVNDICNEKVDLTHYINLLLEGHPRESYRFGKEIARQDYMVSELVNSSIEYIINKHGGNFGFLIGLCEEMDQEGKEALYSRFREHQDLQPFSFQLFSSTKANIDQILSLFSVAQHVKGGVANFVLFAYGQSIEHLPIADRIIFIDKLLENGITGKQVATELINMDVFSNKDHFSDYHAILRRLLFEPDLFDQSELNRDISYGWGELMLRLLLEQPIESKRISKHVISLYRIHNDNSDITVDIRKIMDALYSTHFEDFWESFSTILLDDDIVFKQRLKFDFGWHNGSTISVPILDASSNFAILKWCTEQGDVAAVRIIGFVQLYNLVDGHAIWTELALTLIKQYNSNDRFTAALSSNLGSYSSVGSGLYMINYIIELYTFLLEIDEIAVKSWVYSQIDDYKRTAKYLKQEHEERYIGYD